MPGSFSKSYREASLALTVSGFTGLLAGLILGYMTGLLHLVPGLMVLIPPAIGMRGNIFGAMGSRLGTAMHTGVFSTSLNRRGHLAQNVYASILLTVIGSVALGYLAYGVSAALGVDSIGAGGFVIISLVAGVVSGLVLIAATVALSYLGFVRGLDIDNTSAPLVTVIGDIVTLPSLFLAAVMYLSVTETVIQASLALLTAAAVASFLAANRGGLDVTRNVVRESTPPLILAGGINALAGLTLEARLEALVGVPALLVLIPPFLEEAGALGGVLSSRLSSNLHTGLTDETLNPAGSVDDFRMTAVLALYVFPLVGVLSHLVASASGLQSPGLLKMTAISLAAGAGTTVAICLTAFLVSVLSFRRGFDPDNYAIPFVTSAVDVVGVLFLVAAIYAI